MDTIAPLMDLWKLPLVQENIEESARIFFSNTDQTVSLIPALIAGVLAVLLLLGFPLLKGLLGGDGGGGSGYGAPAEPSGYGAPDAGYGAPDAGYGAPDAGYGAPATSYDAPAFGYDAPASGYDAPSSGYDAAPASGYNAGRRKRDVELPREAMELYSDLMENSRTVDVNSNKIHLNNPALLQAEANAIHNSAKLLI